MDVGTTVTIFRRALRSKRLVFEVEYAGVKKDEVELLFFEVERFTLHRETFLPLYFNLFTLYYLQT